MSCATCTARAVGSEARATRLALWRAIEAQHVAVTWALVDDLAEQEIFEGILEAAKLPRPAAQRPLDHLLYTPFRYAAPAYGSRLRALRVLVPMIRCRGLRARRRAVVVHLPAA